MLGAKRKILSGYSSASAGLHQGFIYASDIIQNCPEEYRGKAARVVGAKCTLLARIDAYGTDPSGAQGAQMKVRLSANGRAAGGMECLSRMWPGHLKGPSY